MSDINVLKTYGPFLPLAIYFSFILALAIHLYRCRKDK